MRSCNLWLCALDDGLLKASHYSGLTLLAPWLVEAASRWLWRTNLSAATPAAIMSTIAQRNHNQICTNFCCKQIDSLWSAAKSQFLAWVTSDTCPGINKQPKRIKIQQSRHATVTNASPPFASVKTHVFVLSAFNIKCPVSSHYNKWTGHLMLAFFYHVYIQFTPQDSL